MPLIIRTVDKTKNGRDRLNFAFIAIDESGNSVSYIPQFKEKRNIPLKMMH